MFLHRFTIGILFNEKMFRLASLHGLLTDEILALRGNRQYIGKEYYTKVRTQVTSTREMLLSIEDDGDGNCLSVQPQQFVFKKVSPKIDISVDTSKAIKECIELWKTAHKVMQFPAIRRIGFVAEYRIPEKVYGSAGIQLIESLTKFNSPGSSSSFNLTFENTNLSADGKTLDKTTDQFWNTIFNFYTSERDETPLSGYLNANIDVQRYYAPAKQDPIKELKTIEKKFNEERTSFSTLIGKMGLV